MTVLIAFVLLLFVVPSVSAVSAEGAPSSSTITKYTGSYTAGYFIETKCNLNNPGCPGTLLSFQATWNVPTVTCVESGEIFSLIMGVAYAYGVTSAGSTLDVYCTGITASYYFVYNLGGSGGGLGADTISPGDKMKTIGSVVPSTGAVSVEIKDITKGWTFGPVTGTISVFTGNGGGAVFLICGTPAYGGCASSVTTPLPKFTTIKFTNVKLTILGHSGSPGSFLSISKIGTYEEIWKNLKANGGTGHVVAEPTSITSTSTGFSIKWLKGL
jgi:hypothetical protein